MIALDCELDQRIAPPISGAAPVLVWLDVGPEGRVLSLDPAFRHLVTSQVTHGDVFFLQPEEAFFEALKAANRRADPLPTVLYPAGSGMGGLRQVNVLPVEHGRVRLVLFLDPREGDTHPVSPHLTPRERMVLNLLAAGMRRDRVAWELNISLPTVDMHARNLRQKLNAPTTSAAVAQAAQQGMLDL